MMGKVHMSGIVPKLTIPKPETEIVASDIAVGSSVFLNVNGAPREFLVVNHGIPSDSSLYDSSCDGLWLMMKDLYTTMKWDATNNSYSASDVHSYLKNTFLGLLDADVQSAIKEVKIPYKTSSGSSGSLASGANGLSVKVFLLGAYETGFDSADVTSTVTVDATAVDGALLEFFSGTGDSAANRIAYYNGTATNWWLRTAISTYGNYVVDITYQGKFAGHSSYTYSYGVRPALILPLNTVFDGETLLFKGVG